MDNPNTTGFPSSIGTFASQTVTIADKTVVTETPSAGYETVTLEATISGGTLDELFVRQTLTGP